MVNSLLVVFEFSLISTHSSSHIGIGRAGPTQRLSPLIALPGLGDAQKTNWTDVPYRFFGRRRRVLAGFRCIVKSSMISLGGGSKQAEFLTVESAL